jgi:hypothetical protein
LQGFQPEMAESQEHQICKDGNLTIRIGRDPKKFQMAGKWLAGKCSPALKTEQILKYHDSKQKI